MVLAGDGDRVGMGLFFYPRGGSAQVAGYLSRALAVHGWRVTLACGSLGGSGALGNAATVFGGVDIVPALYDDAVARWERGEDPMDAPFPMHPSFEARAGMPDRGFPWVSPAQGERMAAAWARLLAGSGGMTRARLLHLHHITPIHDAAASVLPGVPVVTHLHGTELKMLDAIARARAEHRRTACPVVGGAHAPCRAAGGRDHHHLSLRPERGRAAARARPVHGLLDRQRRGRRAVHRTTD